MALLGLSLVLASVIWLVFRPPPLMETLMAMWRGRPQIQQTPTTKAPESTAEHDTRTQRSSTPPPDPRVRLQIEPDGDAAADADRAVMPPPPPPRISQPEDPTTPKASAAPSLSLAAAPSLSLSPPASAAALARAGDAAATASAPAPMPSLSTGPMMAPPPPGRGNLMPPPPRPPTLNGTNGSSLMPPPSAGASARARPNSLAAAARQPGTSTLAPPPTHSTKPAKPSRKVVLEPGHSPLDWARLANGPTSDLRGLPPGTPYLKVTPSMLRRMTGRRGKDAWTALGGRVYNLSPYLPFHPGGEPELLRAAGRDGTKLFGEIHPWVNYEGMLATSLIGMMVEEGEEQGNGAMDEMD